MASMIDNIRAEATAEANARCDERLSQERQLAEDAGYEMGWADGYRARPSRVRWFMLGAIVVITAAPFLL